MARDPLDIIEQAESKGKNVPNYKYGPGFTASGYYQMINGTWRRWAKDAGIDISQYPTAMSAPKEVQRAVAEHGFKTEGFKPWEATKHLVGQEANYGSPARPTPSKPNETPTPRKDGAPGPADVPVLPDGGVDKGLLAIREFKSEVETKQQQEAHQAAVNQAQEQMARQQEQAAQPMSPTAPLAALPPTPAPSEAADFAALMLPRIRRGLLADPSDYGLLGGRYS